MSRGEIRSLAEPLLLEETRRGRIEGWQSSCWRDSAFGDGRHGRCVDSREDGRYLCLGASWVDNMPTACQMSGR
jgi:hypothetical protein